MSINGLRWVPFFVWEATSHCGRSIELWAFWSVLIAVVFAAIYYWGFGCDSIVFNVDKLNGVQPGFWGYLYYSVVTFTTLGFGDIVPLTNPARLAVGAEVVLGHGHQFNKSTQPWRGLMLTSSNKERREGEAPAEPFFGFGRSLTLPFLHLYHN